MPSQHQTTSVVEVGFTDKSRGSGPNSNGSVATPANYTSIAALDARLTAISGTTYPQSQLNKMTVNDKVFAVRKNDDAGTI